MTCEIDILAVGSPYGDDAIGLVLGEKLAEVYRDVESINVYILERPTIGILRYLELNHKTFIIDAMLSGRPVGEIFAFGLDELPLCFSSNSSHAVGVAESLQLAESLGVLPTEVTLWGIEIDLSTINIPGAALSKAIEIKMPDYLEWIEQRLAECNTTVV